MTYDAVGPPPSPPSPTGFGHVTGLRDDVNGGGGGVMGGESAR